MSGCRTVVLTLCLGFLALTLIASSPPTSSSNEQPQDSSRQGLPGLGILGRILTLGMGSRMVRPEDLKVTR